MTRAQFVAAVTMLAAAVGLTSDDVGDLIRPFCGGWRCTIVPSEDWRALAEPVVVIYTPEDGLVQYRLDETAVPA